MLFLCVMTQPTSPAVQPTPGCRRSVIASRLSGEDSQLSVGCCWGLSRRLARPRPQWPHSQHCQGRGARAGLEGRGGDRISLVRIVRVTTLPPPHLTLYTNVMNINHFIKLTLLHHVSTSDIALHSPSARSLRIVSCIPIPISNI